MFQAGRWLRPGQGLALGILALGVAVPARADDCATVYKALTDLAAVPAVAQTIDMGGQAAPMQSVAIGDALYTNVGDGWAKLPLAPGGRLGILKSLVPDSASLKDCANLGRETVDGRATTVYSYVPPVPEGMEGLAGAGDPQKLWIADADGLPYRMETGATKMSMTYEGVVAPIQ